MMKEQLNRFENLKINANIRWVRITKVKLTTNMLNCKNTCLGRISRTLGCTMMKKFIVLMLKSKSWKSRKNKRKEKRDKAHQAAAPAHNHPRIALRLQARARDLRRRIIRRILKWDRLETTIEQKKKSCQLNWINYHKNKTKNRCRRNEKRGRRE